MIAAGRPPAPRRRAAPASATSSTDHRTPSMRFTRFLLVPVAALALGACDDGDEVTVNTRPPLAGVRYVNAVADGGAVMPQMTDQVLWSTKPIVDGATYGIPFRRATQHWPTAAGPRQIRVFPADSAIDVVSRVLVDTTITIEPNKNVTLMLVGSAAAGGEGMRFIVIDDTPPALSGPQLAARLVNASSAGHEPATADAWITAAAGTAVAGAPTWAAVGPRSAGAYVVRDTGAFAVRVATSGTMTPLWSAAAPAGAPRDSLISPIAGARAGESALSAYIFPRACPAVPLPTTALNCPALVGLSATVIASMQAPAVTWLIDRVPGASVFQ